MKKILGISLCALFAVSAANADIASKLYVDQQVGTNTTNINNLTTRVDGHDTVIDSLGTAANKDIEYFATAAEGDLAASAVQPEDVTTGGTNGTIAVNGTDVAVKGLGTAAYTESSAYASSSLTTTVNANTGNISTNAGKIAAINNIIEQWDDDVSENHFIKGIVQANGKVTATGKNFETDLQATTNDNAPTSAAVATHVKGAINALNVAATTKDYVKYVGQANGEVVATDADFADAVDSSITENAPTSAAVASHVKGTIEALDVDATTGQFVTRISQADGKIVASAGDFAEDVTTGGTTAPTSDAVVTYVTNQVQDATPEIVTGTTPGAISVDGEPVAVFGLGALATIDTVAAANIDANAVTETQIKDSAVTTAKIKDGTITNADIADGTITTGKIAFSGAQTNALNSGITYNLVADFTSTKQNLDAMLAERTGYNDCKDSEDGCTLVLDAEGFKWEAVTREEGEQ